MGKHECQKSAEFFLIGALCLALFSLAATTSFLLLDTLKLNQPVGLIRFEPFGYLSELRLPKLYLVQSGSIEPTIKTGSIVVNFPSETYNQGDAVSFTRGKNVITHRIYAKIYPHGLDSPASYKTAGDANEDFDNWEIKDSDIIGKVVLSLPYLGYIADFAKKPQGFILLVIVPATIIIYEELRSLITEIVEYAFKFLKRRKDKAVVLLESSGKIRKYGLPRALVLVPAIGSFSVIVAISISFFR